MTKREFETLTGKKVSEMEYAYIEEMYTRCGNMDKQRFCESYKEVDDNPILEYYYNRFCDLEYDLKEKDHMSEMVAYDLINKSVELSSEELVSCAIALIGKKRYLVYKLDKGLPLSDLDRISLKEIIQ